MRRLDDGCELEPEFLKQVGIPVVHRDDAAVLHPGELRHGAGSQGPQALRIRRGVGLEPCAPLGTEVGERAGDDEGLGDGVAERKKRVGVRRCGPRRAQERRSLIHVNDAQPGVPRSRHHLVDEGVVASYVHNAVSPGLGRIGVLVALHGGGDKAALRELGRKIAMHVAATAPLSLNTDDLDPAAIEKERQVLTEKAREEGKPEAMIAKIVEGQINKFQKDVVLIKQPFVMNPDVTIEQLVADTGKELGAPGLHLAGFVRLALGEGVEKVEGPDFASEVAAMTAGQ